MGEGSGGEAGKGEIECMEEDAPEFSLENKFPGMNLTGIGGKMSLETDLEWKWKNANNNSNDSYYYYLLLLLSMLFYCISN